MRYTPTNRDPRTITTAILRRKPSAAYLGDMTDDLDDDAFAPQDEVSMQEAEEAFRDTCLATELSLSLVLSRLGRKMDSRVRAELETIRAKCSSALHGGRK